MKKLSFLPVLALLLAVAASAFTENTPYQSKSTQARHFYLVNGSTIGQYIGAYDLSLPADRQALENKTGCNNTGGECAKGFEQENPTDVNDAVEVWERS